MAHTTEEIKMQFRDYGTITIPKGTRITHQTACGLDPTYNFVADLSWIPLHEIDGKTCKQYGLIHDATYYGINVPAEFVTDEPLTTP